MSDAPATIDAPAEPGVGPRWAPGVFVIFTHIQKTAGMTVQGALRRRFGPSLARRAVWRATNSPKLSGDLETAIRARSAGDGFVAGHFCFGAHRLSPSPSTYMTFLRDPLARLKSLYRYSKTVDHAYYYSIAKDRSFEEFVFDAKLHECDNGQVRFIAGDQSDIFINRTDFGEAGDDLLEIAKKNLDKYFFFVGTQERFDASFALLARRLDWPKAVIIDVNRRKHAQAEAAAPTTAPKAEAISPELADRVRTFNRLDQALFDYGAARLERDLSEAFSDVDAAVAEIAERSQRIAGRAALAQRLKHAVSGGVRYES